MSSSTPRSLRVPRAPLGRVAPALALAALACAFPAPAGDTAGERPRAVADAPRSLPAARAGLPSAQPFLREAGAFVLPLGAHSVPARFDAAGLTLRSPGASAPVGLRFVGWGPVGRALPLAPVAPALGACADPQTAGPRCVRRLEYAHGAVTAWWVGRGRGVQFGWTVHKPPPGFAGAVSSITLQVEVGGAAVHAAGAGVLLRGEDGAHWTVSPPVAWDGAGRPLGAVLSVDGPRLVVTVDVAGAQYPITIDPVLEAGAIVGVGTAAYDRYGSAVAGVGDLNGDGYKDVAIGAPFVDTATHPDAGAVFVYLGTATGLGSTPSAALSGSAGAPRLGFSVAGVGDVNADGYDDLLVGAPDGVGTAHLFLGAADGLAPAPDLILQGDVPGQAFGWSVAGAGDLDSDGHDDVVVTALHYDDPATAWWEGAAAYVFRGGPAGLLPVAREVVVWGGAGCGSMYDAAATAAGDVNRDGFLDLVFGAHYESCSTDAEVSAAVFHGSILGFADVPAMVVDGAQVDVGGGDVPAADAWAGVDAAGVGDLNLDGFADLLVVTAYTAGDVVSGAGVHLFLGSAAGVPALPNRSLFAFGAGAAPAIAAAGDVNGDGHPDVALAGLDSAVAFGGPSGILALAALREPAPSAVAVGGAGDVNRDGYADILVGAPHDDGRGLTDDGISYLVFGFADADADGFGADGAPGRADCDDADPARHPVAAERCNAVDDDCDGLVDDADPDAASSEDRSSFSPDSDGDGFGDAAGQVQRCAAPLGFVADATDCDDTRSTVHPGAVEVPGDGIDQDCDGADIAGEAPDSGPEEPAPPGSEDSAAPADGPSKRRGGGACAVSPGGALGPSVWALLGLLGRSRMKRPSGIPGPGSRVRRRFARLSG